MEHRIIYNARGRIGIINETGTDERYIVPDVPDQIAWHRGPAFADGRRIILMSTEGERTWEHNVRSHLWIHDFESGETTEIATNDPPAAYVPACALLPGEKRIIVNPIFDHEQRVWTMNLDGTDQVPLTHEGEGFTYGVVLSPRSRHIAFHVTEPSGYHIVSMSIDGTGRTSVAKMAGHLLFGPTWSPDGEWLVFQDCVPANDPGHDRADLWIVKPDGSGLRRITEGQNHWFATSYGPPEARGSGSNVAKWSPTKNELIYTRMLPGSRTAWQFKTDRPDTDHFNRDYLPDEARGGTELCMLDPFAGTLHALTSPGEQVWDFRAEWSPDGTRIAFCRSKTGEPSGLWVMNADGTDQHLLTTGPDGTGVDHPLWL